MTQTLDCPKCGGPLSFEPHPGDETIECPFCHETVVIPEELRIPLPQPIVIQQLPRYQTKSLRWVMISILMFIFIAVVIAGIIIAYSPNETTDNSSFDESSYTSVPLSDTDSVTATVEAKATMDALMPILQLEQTWPASFIEKFSDNSHKWDIGDVRDSYITGNRSISKGTYTWNITTIQSAIHFSFPKMPNQQDFYASVDMKLVNMPDDTDADAGLLFRYNSTDQSWYYFSVNDWGQYYFGWFDGTDWYTLIPETDSDTILSGQINRLTVGVQGSQFIFLINDQMIDHFIDDNLNSGTIGLAVNLPQPGEKASVEFTNFSVLSKSTNP